VLLYLLAGDTLFALGCGRLFEGDPPMMWSSLSKLLPLPRDTLVYCAHEYTQSNARFAVHIDPNNQALAARKVAIDEARSKVGVADGMYLSVDVPLGKRKRLKLGLG
jgi:hydroxyacylglutathione hydrolase